MQSANIHGVAPNVKFKILLERPSLGFVNISEPDIETETLVSLENHINTRFVTVSDAHTSLLKSVASSKIFNLSHRIKKNSPEKASVTK